LKPKQRAMLGMTATAAAGGVIAAWFGLAKPAPLTEGLITAFFGFMSMLFPFAWLLEDRRERGLRRSYWFNVGVVAFTSLVVPVYLWRSRPRGRKALSLLGLIGVLFAALTIMIGSSIATSIALSLVYGWEHV
jgi:hypothetical protein